MLVIPAGHFTRQTGVATYVFVLAAAGRADPARLGLADDINIYR